MAQNEKVQAEKDKLKAAEEAKKKQREAEKKAKEEAKAAKEIALRVHEEEKVRAQLRAPGQSISTPNTPRNKGPGVDRETDIGWVRNFVFWASV